jgi:uncharacterized protein YggE
MNRFAVGCTLFTLLAAPAFAQTTTLSSNAIQPETSLSITTTGDATRAPDIAYITAGVENEAKTAKEAMAANARSMNAVMKALKAAGVADKDVQTSNFSLNSRYDFVKDGKNENNGKQVLAGYIASNLVTAKVIKLGSLGGTLDALVGAGSNTINDVRFALEDSKSARDEASRQAMKEAVQRANLYADAAGYKVARIVTINESFQTFEPRPKAMMMRAMASEGAPTPMAAGELTFSTSVTVLFELKK